MDSFKFCDGSPLLPYQLATEALRYVEVVGEKLVVVNANVCRVFITLFRANTSILPRLGPALCEAASHLLQAAPLLVVILTGTGHATVVAPPTTSKLQAAELAGELSAVELELLHLLHVLLDQVAPLAAALALG